LPNWRIRFLALLLLFEELALAVTFGEAVAAAARNWRRRVADTAIGDGPDAGGDKRDLAPAQRVASRRIFD
jgi:hypothetical protein